MPRTKKLPGLEVIEETAEKPKETAEEKERRKKHKAVAERFSAFRPAREVLRPIRAVPTRFVQFDYGTRVGGFPIERFNVVHGPSNEGKSLFVLGLCDSFLARNHFAFYIDAERTTTNTWLDELMGTLSAHPRFFAARPTSYEDTMAEVRNFLNHVHDARAAGEVEPDTTAIVVVDSLRKLVPKGLMKEILDATDKQGERKEAKGSEIKVRDRRAQVQAQINALWMDELTPLLEHSQAGFIAIAREMANPNAADWGEEEYIVGGGGSIIYDSALRVRIERESWVTHGKFPEQKVYGERHRATVLKTKIAGKDDKKIVTHFHSSNGVLVPSGFDRARDVLDLALKFGVVKQGGASYGFGGERLGVGEHQTVKSLHARPDVLFEIERAVRAKFSIDLETGEVRA